MKTYNVLKSPSANDFVFISEGFSSTAFLFHALWLLYHKLWNYFAIVLFLVIVVVELQSKELISSNLLSIFQFITSLIIGFFAETWRIKHLINKEGYQLLEIIAANNLDEAKLNFYKSRPEVQVGINKHV